MIAPFITIFTPTYNRGPYLRRLYESLEAQDYKLFEWLIVDDGSVDGTRAEVESFQTVAQFSIRYHYQENAGKHIAVNRGAALARGTLFFIVDSDDMLADHALSTIVRHWESVLQLPESAAFAGVCGLRIYTDGSVIGGDVDYEVLDVSAIDYRFRLGYQGDRAEVVRTEVMKRYPYPDFAGERFCADAVVWNRIAATYRLRFFNDGIYICEYLPGGITDTSVSLRQRSPRSACLYYAEMADLSGLSSLQQFKAAVNFWRFAHHDKTRGWKAKWNQLNTGWSLVAWPIALLIALRDSSTKSTKGG